MEKIDYVLNSQTLPILTKEQQNFLESRFTEEDMCMYSPTNTKTLGPNGFSNEYYKLLVPTLTTLYNDIYQQTLVYS